MKDESLRRKLLVKQLMENSGDSPEQLLERLLEEVARLQSELDQLNSDAPPSPVSDPDQQREVIGSAIKKAASQMHRAFNTCQVPNAILTTVTFPDGSYRLTFQRIKQDDKPINN